MTNTSVTFETETLEEEKHGIMNPVGIVGVAMLVTLVLALWLCTALPLVAALPLAWIGGIVASVMLMAVLAAAEPRKF